MNIFISGGCKNGKSTFAQSVAKEIFDEAKAAGKADALYYLATMEPADEEDKLRIALHTKAREGMGFETIEKGRNISGAADRGGIFLVDSITALLSNVMFNWGGGFNKDAGKEVIADVLKFADTVGGAVFVSDYIYGDGSIRASGRETFAIGGKKRDYTREYMQALASVDKALAEKCDRVIEVAFGNVIECK